MAAMADAGAKKKLKTFPGLGADEFQHPHDAAATAALSSVPGLDTIVAKVMELGLERVYYLENTADNVRVTARMLPSRWMRTVGDAGCDRARSFRA